jgi:acetyl-CoA synthetase
MGCRQHRDRDRAEAHRHDVPMQPGRDLWWHDVVAGPAPHCEPEWVDAEHPLFLLYTSGSTGKPKGIQHSSAGYLLGAKLTTEVGVRHQARRRVLVHRRRRLGHRPQLRRLRPARQWRDRGDVRRRADRSRTPGASGRSCQDHGVTIFYTAPTAIRALMKLGDEIPAKLRPVLAAPARQRRRADQSRGVDVVPARDRRERCPIVDTWWQTETGAIMISPVPGVTATKPGSCTHPAARHRRRHRRRRGQPVRAGGGRLSRDQEALALDAAHHLGRQRALHRTYWASSDNRYYVAGDSAHRDKDGCFWIMGRIDDVLNVAGHRLGTMEIESALVAHPRRRGRRGRPPARDQGRGGVRLRRLPRARPPADTRALAEELRAWVAEQLGAIAKPDDIRFADNLPKTRSGKIMRRLLRTIARGARRAIVETRLAAPRPGSGHHEQRDHGVDGRSRRPPWHGPTLPRTQLPPRGSTLMASRSRVRSGRSASGE